MLSKKEILGKALSSLEALLAQYPEDKRLLKQLALLYLELGRFDHQALKIYDRASEDNPTETKLHRALSIALLLQQIEDIPEAIEHVAEIGKETLQDNIFKLSKLTELQPQSLNIKKALGDLLLINGQEEEALQYYHQATKGWTQEVNYILGSLKRWFDKGLDPKTETKVFFAHLLYETDNQELARALLLQAYKEGHREKTDLTLLADLLNSYIQQVDNKQERQDTLIDLSSVYLAIGEEEKAIATADQIDPSTVNDIKHIKEVARVLIGRDDLRHAFNFLSKIPLDEESKDLINQITQRLEERGELDTAVYLLRFINENDIFLREVDDQRQKELGKIAEIGLGELYLKQGKYNDALQRFIRVLNYDIDNYKEIINKIDKVLTKYTDLPPEQLCMIGDILREKGNYPWAANYFELAVQKEPHNDETLQKLHFIYDKILEENPHLYELRLRRGDIRYLQGDVEGAISDYKDLELEEEVSDKAKRKLAEVYYQTGNLSMALEKYRELPLGKYELDSLYEVTCSFINNGEFESALEGANLVSAIDPDYRDIKDKLNVLRREVKESVGQKVADKRLSEIIGAGPAGRYKFMEKIGSGGMGVVYKVYDMKLGKIAAMKVLRENLSNQDRALHRFFWEALTAARLNHRNIINIYDYNISPQAGKSYISMEYVSGPSLREVLEKRYSEATIVDPDYLKKILHYMIQLCEALDATHRKGIIHRDIKPDNIMVTEEEVVKITDFGIVHIDRARLTPTGAMVGTPRYMSPEQVQGLKLDPRSDIYSVGIIFYELLVGSPPFLSGDVAYQQVNVEPTLVREIVEDIPDPVNYAIMKCLEKDPDKRYQSANELRQDFKKILSDLGGYESEVCQRTTTQHAVTSVEIDEDIDSVGMP